MKKREELIELVEFSTNQLRLLIQQGIAASKPQVAIIAEARTLIHEVEQKLKEQTDDKEFIDEEIKGLKQLLTRWMNTYLLGLLNVAKTNKSGFLGEILKGYSLLDKNNELAKPIKNGGLTIVGSDKDLFLANQGITNIREFMTNPVEGGVGRYDDYGQKIRDEIERLQQQYAVDPATLTDAKGNKKNLRAMAEIKVRYDMISDDLKGKDVKFVVASSHPNASERCSWWQGKIFLVDLDVESRGMHEYKGKPIQTILGHIDGRPYYSLKQAVENGFLSYNCQHRLIRYYKGVKPPKYDQTTIERKRNLTSQQRALENKIRKIKMIEKINGRSSIVRRKNLTTGQMEEMKASDYSKMLQEKYKSFCKQHGLVQYTWRLRVVNEERK